MFVNEARVKTYPVKINGKTYSLEFQTDASFAKAWKAVLQRAHAQRSEVTCCCPGRGTRQLAPKHYDASDAFGLARYPESGEEHATDCIYYAPNADKSGLGGYDVGVVDERGDGTVKIRMGIGLKVADQNTTPCGEQRPPAVAGRKQPAMSLLGLLHYLWSEANLNTWWPRMTGKRNPFMIGVLLDAAAKKVRVSRGTLSDALLVFAPQQGRGSDLLNAAKLAAAIKSNRRVVVVTQLRDWTQEVEAKTARFLPLAAAYGIPFLNLSAGDWSNVCDRFPLAVAAWRGGGKVVAIVQAEPSVADSGKTRATVVSMALMQVTENWIPVDSSYEYAIADMLTSDGRAFLKPLRFDADKDQVFPDFVLLDTNCAGGTPMEVFGRTDETYEARKAAKIVFYNANYGTTGWWMWNAAAGEPVPLFPANRNA